MTSEELLARGGEAAEDPINRGERDGATLATRGLYLELPGWRPTVLALTLTQS
jgi:hypothetical protein